MTKRSPSVRSIVDVEPGRINRLNDRFFKYLFGREEHRNLLLDFINDMVFPHGERRFTQVLELNTELAPGGVDLKLSRLDLSALVDDGVTVDIEVQVVNYHDFRKRAPFYWSMRHAGKMKKGTSYLDVTPTIVICVLAFTLLDEEEAYRNVYGIVNEASGRALCQDMKIIYVELDKFRERAAMPETGLERWLVYLSNEEGERMTMSASFDKEIGQALDMEKIFWADEKERFRYIAEQKLIMDALSIEATHQVLLRNAQAEGEARGRAEGVRDQTLLLARRMLSQGMAASDIVTVTGLSPDEVAQLHDGMKRSQDSGSITL